jgi:voltage-gated potassium channel
MRRTTAPWTTGVSGSQSGSMVPVVVAAALVIPPIVVEQVAGEPWQSVALVLNWTTWAVFAAELVVMLIFVPKRWRWLRDHPLELAIVLLTPPFLPASLQAIRVLRLLRLLRLLVLVRAAQRLLSGEGLKYAAFLALLTAVGGGAAFSSVEKGRSTWDGVWWAVSTMTTVGYGDIAPITNYGRVIAIVVMLVGIGFIALVTGALAQRFLAGEVRQEVGELEAVRRTCSESFERSPLACIGLRRGLRTFGAAEGS